MDPRAPQRMVGGLMEAFLPIVVLLGIGTALAMVIQSRFPAKESKLLLASFGMHVLFVALNAYMIKVIYGRGDPVAFVENGGRIAEAVFNDPVNVLPELVNMLLQQPFTVPVDVHGGKGSTYTMFALAALAELFIGSSFYSVHLFYGLLSYLGKVGMYTAFRSWISPHHRLPVLVATCMIPSVVFWSAGIIKESLVVTFLGTAMFGAHLVAKRRPMGIAVLILGVYGVALIKSFILLVLVISFAAWLYWWRAVRSGAVEIKPMSMVGGVVVAAVGFAVVGYLFPKYSLANLGAEAAASQAVGFRTGSGSYYQIGNPDDTSLFGQLRYAPMGLFAGWFRPGLWEARNPQMLINGLETGLFLLATLRTLFKTGYNGVVQRMVAYPPLVFCIVFAVVMGVGTGLTSFNLGSLSRYRMPLLPFLVTALVILNTPVKNGRRRVKKKVTRKRRQNTSRSPI